MRGGTVEGRLGRIEEALENIKSDRTDARSDRAEVMTEVRALKSDLAGLTQTVRSTGDAIVWLNNEKISARLTAAEEHIRTLLQNTKQLPAMELEYNFWKRVLGTGVSAVWKVALLVLGSSTLSVVLTKWLWPH